MLIGICRREKFNILLSFYATRVNYKNRWNSCGVGGIQNRRICTIFAILRHSSNIRINSMDLLLMMNSLYIE